MFDLKDVEAPDPLIEALSASSQLFFTTHGGKKMAWRRWGQGNVIVMLHGATGSWRHWVRNIAHFAGDHTVLVPDLPGFGLSDIPGPSDTISDIAEAVIAGLDQILGPRDCYHLAAFSFGGSIASALIAARPGRQLSLALVSTASIGPRIGPAFVSVRDKSGAALVSAHHENLALGMFGDPLKIDLLALRVQVKNTAESRLDARRRAPAPLLTETLTEFQAPAKAFWGARDVFLFPGFLQDRQALLRAVKPDMECVVLDKAGHWLMFEASAAFNAQLHALIAKA